MPHKTHVPLGEHVTVYSSRNFWKSNLDRARLVVAQHPEAFPTIETLVNTAIACGLHMIESKLATEKNTHETRREHSS